MADELVKMKTGTIAKLQQGISQVPLDKGSIYFAVDTEAHKGKIVYDAPVGTNGVDRIVMSTDAEKADYATTAGNAANATQASSLTITNPIDGINFNGTAAVNHYNLCETAANVAAKTVACNNFVLGNGARIIVKYANTNTASNPTLNVNNTGAKAIYYHNERIPVDALKANELHEYIYDGLNWVYVGTIALNIGITIDDNSYTMFITSPIVNGDGVSY